MASFQLIDQLDERNRLMEMKEMIDNEDSSFGGHEYARGLDFVFPTQQKVNHHRDSAGEGEGEGGGVGVRGSREGLFSNPRRSDPVDSETSDRTEMQALALLNIEDGETVRRLVGCLHARNAELHSAQCQLRHAQLQLQARKNRELELISDLEKTNVTLAETEEDILLLEAKLREVAGFEGRQDRDLFEDLRGKLIVAANDRIAQLSEELLEAKLNLESSLSDRDSELNRLEADNLSLRRELGRLSDHLAQRTVLYAMQERRWQESNRTTEVKSSQLHDQVAILQGRLLEVQSQCDSTSKARMEAELQVREQAQVIQQMSREYANLQEKFLVLQSDYNTSASQIISLQSANDRLRGAEVVDLDQDFTSQLSLMKSQSIAEINALRSQMNEQTRYLASERSQNEKLMETNEELLAKLRSAQELLVAVESAGIDVNSYLFRSQRSLPAFPDEVFSEIENSDSEHSDKELTEEEKAAGSLQHLHSSSSGFVMDRFQQETTKRTNNNFTSLDDSVWQLCTGLVSVFVSSVQCNSSSFEDQLTSSIREYVNKLAQDDLLPAGMTEEIALNVADTYFLPVFIAEHQRFSVSQDNRNESTVVANESFLVPTLSDAFLFGNQSVDEDISREFNTSQFSKSPSVDELQVEINKFKKREEGLVAALQRQGEKLATVLRRAADLSMTLEPTDKGNPPGPLQDSNDDDVASIRATNELLLNQLDHLRNELNLALSSVEEARSIGRHQAAEQFEGTIGDLNSKLDAQCVELQELTKTCGVLRDQDRAWRSSWTVLVDWFSVFCPHSGNDSLLAFTTSEDLIIAARRICDVLSEKDASMVKIIESSRAELADLHVRCQHAESEAVSAQLVIQARDAELAVLEGKVKEYIEIMEDSDFPTCPKLTEFVSSQSLNSEPLLSTSSSSTGQCLTLLEQLWMKFTSEVVILREKLRDLRIEMKSSEVEITPLDVLAEPTEGNDMRTDAEISILDDVEEDEEEEEEEENDADSLDGVVLQESNRESSRQEVRDPASSSLCYTSDDLNRLLSEERDRLQQFYHLTEMALEETHNIHVEESLAALKAQLQNEYNIRLEELSVEHQKEIDLLDAEILDLQGWVRASKADCQEKEEQLRELLQNQAEAWNDKLQAQMDEFQSTLQENSKQFETKLAAQAAQHAVEIENCKLHIEKSELIAKLSVEQAHKDAQSIITEEKRKLKLKCKAQLKAQAKQFVAEKDELVELIRQECIAIAEETKRLRSQAKAEALGLEQDGLRGVRIVSDGVGVGVGSGKELIIYPEMLSPEVTYELVRSIASRSQNEEEFRAIFQSAHLGNQSSDLSASQQRHTPLNRSSTNRHSETKDNSTNERSSLNIHSGVALSLSLSTNANTSTRYLTADHDDDTD